MNALILFDALIVESERFDFSIMDVSIENTKKCHLNYNVFGNSGRSRKFFFQRWSLRKLNYKKFNNKKHTHKYIKFYDLFLHFKIIAF